ncbi:response regulator transcription factor [Streptomyces sp. HNA39]|uniref:response regulator transcription factor n=1 Tax=Streptomyces sp. HNA39 TaxID=2850561 RepID=UPI00200D9351|nr:response regulator transcription factor [Streptomyces sp. HNA39]UQA34972.1 response regulator transcription factor [Streptomyces sp. HNA39]
MAAGPGPLDVRMPHCDGLSVLMDLRRLEHPPVAAILRGAIAPRAARTVIHGYVNRENQEDRVDRESRQTLEDRESPLGRATAAAESLTTREREVLVLLAEGLSNTEIGKRLYIGTTTVKDHVSVLLGKLGVANRVQAAVRAHRQGLVGSVTAGMRRTA